MRGSIAHGTAAGRCDRGGGEMIGVVGRRGGADRPGGAQQDRHDGDDRGHDPSHPCSLYQGNPAYDAGEEVDHGHRAAEGAGRAVRLEGPPDRCPEAAALSDVTTRTEGSIAGVEWSLPRLSPPAAWRSALDGSGMTATRRRPSSPPALWRNGWAGRPPFGCSRLPRTRQRQRRPARLAEEAVVPGTGRTPWIVTILHTRARATTRPSC